MDPQVIAAVIGGIALVGTTYATLRQTGRIEQMKLVDARKDQELRRKEKELEEKQVAEQRYVAALATDALPEEFREEAAYVNAVRLFRKNLTAKVSFKEIDREFLEFEMEVSFTVVNYEKNPITYAHRVEVEEGDRPGIDRVLRVAASGDDVSSRYDRSYSANEVCREFKQDVVVRANGSGPDNLFMSRIRRTARAKDAEVLLLFEAAYDAKVIIENVEQQPGDLEVSVEFAHRAASGNVVIITDNRKRPVQWRLKKAFLPWQCVYIQWQRKGSDPQPQTGASKTPEASQEQSGA